MFERFTDEARRVVVYAQEECRLRNDPHIGTEHLLLGSSHGPTVTSQVLRDAGFAMESARRHLDASTPPREWATTGHIPFTPRAKQTMEESLRVSNRLGQAHIAPPHLLRALLSARDSGAVRLLVALGVDVDTLAARAAELASASKPDTLQVVRHGPITAYLGNPGEPSMRTVIQHRDRLRSALARYGQHENRCNPQKGCTCGLAEALSEEGA